MITAFIGCDIRKQGTNSWHTLRLFNTPDAADESIIKDIQLEFTLTMNPKGDGQCREDD